MHRHQPISQNYSCRQVFILLLTHLLLLLKSSHSLEYHKQHPSQNCRTLSTHFLSSFCSTANVRKKFVDKISKLHLNLQSNPASSPAHFLTSTPPSVLHHFTPATLSQISDLLSHSLNLHCNLDPIPTTVLKKIANEIATTILFIVNLSLLTRTFPSYLKASLISPLLKKPSLNTVPLPTYPLYQKSPKS